MKKILLFFIVVLFATTASANHIAIYTGQARIPDEHTHKVAHRAHDRANVAIFIGAGALMVATIGLLKASEYNQGQVQIARF